MKDNIRVKECTPVELIVAGAAVVTAVAEAPKAVAAVKTFVEKVVK